jgi:hypothetical protein
MAASYSTDREVRRRKPAPLERERPSFLRRLKRKSRLLQSFAICSINLIK